MSITVAEYIWLDGSKPTGQIRSKTRVISAPDEVSLEDFPEWSFDGSSTQQAHGEDSDCILKPVNFVLDPLENGGDFLVLCEVMNPDGTVHESNKRAILRKVMEDGGETQEPWMGFEQEYTMFKKNIPLGWPEHGFPGMQGPYYCGVGSEQIFGRELATKHRDACIDAGIMYYGMNAEVMPGQWEYQIFAKRGLFTVENRFLGAFQVFWWGPMWPLLKFLGGGPPAILMILRLS